MTPCDSEYRNDHVLPLAEPFRRYTEQERSSHGNQIVRRSNLALDHWIPQADSLHEFLLRDYPTFVA